MAGSMTVTTKPLPISMQPCGMPVILEILYDEKRFNAHHSSKLLF